MLALTAVVVVSHPATFELDAQHAAVVLPEDVAEVALLVLPGPALLRAITAWKGQAISTWRALTQRLVVVLAPHQAGWRPAGAYGHGDTEAGRHK